MGHIQYIIYCRTSLGLAYSKVIWLAREQLGEESMRVFQIFILHFNVFILGFIQIQHLEEMVRKCLVFGETCRAVAQQASLILAYIIGWEAFSR